MSISAHDHKRISVAIHAAEAKTSGEIVCVLAQASSDATALPILLAALAALALPWLQMLHALSFGATHLGALMFLSQRAPRGQAATAQGYLAIAAGLAMAAATAISGMLYADFGSGAYIAMALVAVAGGACGFVAHRIRGEPAR